MERFVLRMFVSVLAVGVVSSFPRIRVSGSEDVSGGEGDRQAHCALEIQVHEYGSLTECLCLGTAQVARDTGAALRLGLPSNATSIRSSEMLSEKFSCAGRHYGYYADPDNDCQLFHVCLPVQFDDGRGSMYKWSFVCPEETVFNQETFTCSRREDAIACQDSERFYGLNEDLGVSRKQQQQQEAEEAAEEAAEDGMADVVEDATRLTVGGNLVHELWLFQAM
ncbi:U-scoloptoxin(01)-Cw1a [Frankliniella fusca]|uniref:U-scoloptoxin(01)-Cw1a n=1 Tax=Frankliniella fusca TaxID=407009 RepID=A0AAE1LSQ6_9NEOP|nr:U-scoloptoxin(01)-Cw1a [Frankliniella fusca]